MATADVTTPKTQPAHLLIFGARGLAFTHLDDTDVLHGHQHELLGASQAILKSARRLAEIGDPVPENFQDQMYGLLVGLEVLNGLALSIRDEIDGREGWRCRGEGRR